MVGVAHVAIQFPLYEALKTRLQGSEPDLSPLQLVSDFSRVRMMAFVLLVRPVVHISFLGCAYHPGQRVRKFRDKVISNFAFQPQYRGRQSSKIHMTVSETRMLLFEETIYCRCLQVLAPKWWHLRPHILMRLFAPTCTSAAQPLLRDLLRSVKM